MVESSFTEECENGFKALFYSLRFLDIYSGLIYLGEENNRYQYKQRKEWSNPTWRCKDGRKWK